MTKITPLIFDTVQHVHTQAPDGSVFDVSYIPASTDVKNVLTKDANGVLVKAEDLVSTTEGNILHTAVDNKLSVALSDKVTNVLTKDTSNNVLLEARALISTDASNGMVIGTDNKLKTLGVSTDEFNALHKGQDGGLYISAEDFITHDSMSPFCVKNGKLYFDTTFIPEAQTIVSGENCNLIQPDIDGAAYLRGCDVISSDTGNLLRTGYDGRAYIGYSDVASSVTSNLLQDDGTGKVLLTPNNLLSQLYDNAIAMDNDGRLYAKLGLAYETLTGRLDLTGARGGVLSTVNIPTGASILKSASIVVNPIGQPAGTFIKFVFSTTEGEIVSYANMNALTNIYKAGDGVALNNYTISVKYGLGLKLAGEQLVVNMDRLAGNGLEVTTDVVTGDNIIAVKLGQGLFFDTDKSLGVALHPDQQIIYAGEKGLAAFMGMHVLTANGTDVLECYDHNGNSILATRITLGNGLEGADGTTINVKTLDTLTEGDNTPVNSDAVLNAISGKMLEYDDTPTADSERAVKSKGIYNAILDAEAVAAESDSALEKRIVALETMDTTPTAGSVSAVTSEGIHAAIEDAKTELTSVDEGLDTRITTLEAKDVYQVRTNSDAVNVIYLCGSVAATPMETNMFYNPNVYLSGNTLHAEKFDGKVVAANITGDVTARVLRSDAFESARLSSDKLTLTAPDVYDSYRIWGFVRCSDGNSGTEDVYISGTFAAGATILSREAGGEIQDPTGVYAGFSYRNLNCVGLV